MVLPVPVGAFRMIWRYCITLSNIGVGYPAIASFRSSINDVMYLNRVKSSPLLINSLSNLSKSSTPNILIILNLSYINCIYTVVYYFNSCIYNLSVCISLYADLLSVIVSYILASNLDIYSSEVRNGFAAMDMHIT